MGWGRQSGQRARIAPTGKKQHKVEKFTLSYKMFKRRKKLPMDDTRRIEYNRQVIEEFRANGGKVSGWAPLILLTTRGAKSGQTRIYPLMSVPDGNRYIAVA